MVKEYKGELLFLIVAMGAYVFMATLDTYRRTIHILR